LGTDHSTTAVTGREAGAKSLCFSLAPDLTLTAFEGGLLSFQLCRSPRTAWRFGVDLSARRTAEDSEGERTQQDTIRTTTAAETGERMLAFELSVLHLRHFSAERRLSPYLGIGPFFYLSRLRSDRTEDATAATGVQSRAERDSKSDGRRAGLTALAGLEWSFASRLALHVEYGITGGYEWSDWKATDSEQTAGSTEAHSRTVRFEGSRWFARAVSGRLGVSAYF
jgi:opacity protein-like surface antigen